jgi:hypothetical protein
MKASWQSDPQQNRRSRIEDRGSRIEDRWLSSIFYPRSSIRWPIVGLTLLAFFLRVYRLDHVSLRGDESFTIVFLSNPLPVIWEGIRFTEPLPPLFYLLLYVYIALAGTADFATRYFAVFFGVLAVPLAYVLARRVVQGSGGAGERRSRGAGEQGGRGAEKDSPPHLRTMVSVVTALLVAVNPNQVWHSQDIRNYTLWLALSMASLYLLLRALDDDRVQFWVGYVVTAILSLYTHYFDIFLVLFQNVYVFARYRRRQPLLRRWIVAQAILVAAYTPWPLFLSPKASTHVDLTEIPNLPGLVLRTLTRFTLGEAVSQSQITDATPVMVLLVLLGLMVAFRLRPHVFVFLVLYLGVPLLCTFVFLQFRPIFRERYLNAIAPGYYLAIACGIAGLTRLPDAKRVAPPLMLAAVLVISGISLGQYYFDPRYAKSPDWRTLARYLEVHAGPHDTIVQTYPDPGLAHYYHGPAQRLILPDRPAVHEIGPLPIDRPATAQTLQALLTDGGHVWLIPVRSNWDPAAFVEGWLERRTEKVGEEQVAGHRVVIYRRAEKPLPSFQHPVDARLGDSIRLLGYDLAVEGGIIRPGAMLELTLYWEALTAEELAYTVFTHLVDAAGAIHAQHDGQPQAGAFPTSDWLPGDVIGDTHPLVLPADATPGTYHLLVGLYHLETGERLPAFDAPNHRWPDDAVVLQPALEVTR